MSKHWKLRAVLPPTSGKYQVTFENEDDPSIQINIEVPEIGCYHGHPNKPILRPKVDDIAKKIKKVLDEETEPTP
jgi:hypothetical protein